MSKTDKKSKGMWKRLLHVFTKTKIPLAVYALEAVLGVVGTKLGLMYLPYLSKLQTGDILNKGTLMGFVGLMLVSAIVALAEAIPKFYATHIVTRNLQGRMLHKMLHFPMRRFEQEDAYTLVSHFTLDTEYASTMLEGVVGFITGIIAAVMTFGEMSGTGVKGILNFIILPAVIYVIFSTWIEGKLNFLMEKRMRKALSATTAFFSEHMSSLLGIRQLNAVKAEKKLGYSAIDTIYKADIYKAVLGLFSTCVSGSTSTILTAIIFVLGGALVRKGDIDIVTLVTFYNFVLAAYNTLSTLPSFYTELMSANGELYYVGEMLEEPEEQIKREKDMNREDEDIIFKNVSFAYDDNKVLDDVSFTIPKGKITAIVGPNGCGKSTLFKLIERFYPADGGRIYFGQHDTSDIHLDEWRQSIGYVLQTPQLYDAAIRDNIAYGLERNVMDEEILAAAKQAGIYEFIKENKDGLDFKIGDQGSRLSEGQKQRIAIARAIMMDPSYLLLDEATSNMDIYSAKDVTDALFRLMKGRTTAFISHDPETIKRAEHIIVLNEGRVEAEGTLEEAEKQSETFRQIMHA